MTVTPNFASADAETARRILSIDTPERLFTDRTRVAEEFRRLAKLWHPDLNKDDAAKAVFAHVGDLHRRALEKIASGSWEESGRVHFHTLAGTVQTLKFLVRHEIGIGEMYVASKRVTFAVAKDYKVLVDNAVKRMAFTYKSDRMRAEMARFLPKVVGTAETADRFLVHVEKPEDAILLKDVLAHHGGKLPVAHAAWIVSGLYNIACYLQVAGLAHNDVGPETIFIEPQGHSVLLLGGWWYAADKTLVALPKRSMNIAPAKRVATKTADPRLDLDLIRLTGRELLGDGSGMRLLKDHSPALVSYLRAPSGGDAIAEYKTWTALLERVFGPRRFTPFNLKASEIYHG